MADISMNQVDLNKFYDATADAAEEDDVFCVGLKIPLKEVEKMSTTELLERVDEEIEKNI